MRDNKTSQAAGDYDANVDKTIPRYRMFHDETIDLVKAYRPAPSLWLDTGCGTGTLILEACKHFDNVKFIAADPSEAMLQLAREKLTGIDATYIAAGSEDLDLGERFDVVTAILSHHYLNAETRRKATENCFKMLKPGGLYVTFETIMPNSDAGRKIGLQRWRDAQLRAGKKADAADKHISRYGTELLPITLQDHIALLQAVGFSAVEILWFSGLQAGLYGIK